MAKIQDLKEKRSKITYEMRELTDNPKGSGGDLDSDQEQRFTSLEGELKTIERQIERQAKVDEAERRMEGQQVAGSGDQKYEELVKRYSLHRAIHSQFDPKVDAGLEREVHQEQARLMTRSAEGILVPLGALVPTEKRVALTTGDAGNLVATEHLTSQFIDYLRPNTVAMKLGARTVTGLTGDVAIPKMDAATPAAEWVEENSALTGGDHSFTQSTGEPHHIGLLTELSRKAVMQSNPSLENVSRNDFIKKIGAGIDLAVINGSGSSGEPEGILQKGSINTVSGSNPATYSELVSAVGAVKEADAMSGSMGWAASAKHYAIFKPTLKESGDAGAGYILEPGDNLAGYPVQFTSQMPEENSPAESSLLFGAWDNVLVLFWGSNSVEIMVNPYAATQFSKGNIQIRAFLDCDIIIRHEEAFTEVTGTQV